MTATADSGQTSPAQLLIEEARYRIYEESIPRLKTCLELLTDDLIWYRPNNHTVSAGNLVLHLAGNARQWIVAGLGGAPDTRRRDDEFAERGPIPKDKLIADFDVTMQIVRETLDDLDPDSLTQQRKIQDETPTGVGVIVHVVEHFSYHVGQITYFTKSTLDVDVGYYAGRNLNAMG